MLVVDLNGWANPTAGVWERRVEVDELRARFPVSGRPIVERWTLIAEVSELSHWRRFFWHCTLRTEGPKEKKLLERLVDSFEAGIACMNEHLAQHEARIKARDAESRLESE